MNELIQKLGNLKVLSSVVVALFSSGFTLGYALSPKPKSKQEVCKHEIDQVKILSSQIKTARQEHFQKNADFQKSCISEQNNICAEKILRYRAACLKLKCEVCKVTK